MLVPRQPISRLGSRSSRLLSLSLLFALAATPLCARGPEPPLRILLDTLGFQPLSSQFLLAGSSMLTLHYVDDTHLLITFNVRRLMQRLPDDPEDDQDRNVDALLLELPSGRILARTSWRLHDHGQYLWSIGHGHFLLRVRDTLTTFSPLANLATGEPFREHSFLKTDGRRVEAIMVSPDNGLLTVETVKRTPPAPRPKTPLFGPTPPPPAPEFRTVQINFYRLTIPSEQTENIIPQSAGVVIANGTGTIPTLGAGYIAVIDQGHQHWAFDFNSYSGEKKELAAFDSVCRPSPFFVNGSEFIAFGCHSGNTRQVLGGFNMRGEEPWQQNLYGDYVSPSLVFSSSKGRFALSRILVHSAVTPDQPVVPEQIGAQTIVVYQSATGKQILHAECSPVEPAGQNFTLSPDGLSLALVHADAIEIYRLPQLTTKEDADVKLAEATAPQGTDLPVHFAAEQQSLAASDPGADTQPNSVDTTTTATGAPASALPGSSLTPPAPGSEESSNTEGDPLPGQPRKRPTLYTLPTDPPRTSSDDQPQ